jgi:hypothetical protein
MGSPPIYLRVLARSIYTVFPAGLRPHRSPSSSPFILSLRPPSLSSSFYFLCTQIRASSHATAIPSCLCPSTLDRSCVSRGDISETGKIQTGGLAPTDLQTQNNISVPYNKHFEVPHLLSPVFTGRDDDLQCLTTSFAADPPSQGRHQRRFVLFGLGGSGKTQTCLKYIQEHRERYVKHSD